MKKDIAIYTLTSPLHDEQAVAAVTREFLDTMRFDYDFRGADYADYGSHALQLIFVRTGGTEGVFRQLLPQLRAQAGQPFYLLASNKSNSLPASMEILSYLNQQGLRGEIIHGDPDYVNRRVATLELVATARQKLCGQRLGIIGKPSDWLISSQPDAQAVKAALGIELVDIPIDELVEEYEKAPQPAVENACDNEKVNAALPGAMRIQTALEALIKRHNLNGFTLRCFDMLTAVKNTGCMALAHFNARDIVASCEGDVPAMLSMAIALAVTGKTGFQANPSHIDPITGEILFAHCTIPFNMVNRYTLDTHFESGIGVAICGYSPEGPMTVFKVSSDLKRWFAEDAELLRSQAKPDLCRTQQVIRLADAARTRYFFTQPIGNHHVIVPGHYAAAFNELLQSL